MATFHVGVREFPVNEIEPLGTIEKANHEEAAAQAKRMAAHAGPYWRIYLNGRRITPISRTGKRGQK